MIPEVDSQGGLRRSVCGQVSVNLGSGVEGKFRAWGVYWGFIGLISRFYLDNGKENGNYYLGFKVGSEFTAG